jgi:hypothetical protein
MLEVRIFPGEPLLKSSFAQHIKGLAESSCFVGFGTCRQEAMKTARKENPNRCAITRQPTELLERRLELSLLNQAGWKARKHPAAAKYFF